MYDKFMRFVDAMRADIKAIRSDIDGLSVIGQDGKPGRDGETPDVEEVARIAAGLVATPADGKPGKDGETPNVHEVAHIVAGMIPTPKDGETPDIKTVAELAATLVRAPEDGKPGKEGKPGKGPTASAVAALMPDPKQGPAGLRGAPGPTGKSITKVTVNKLNEVIVAIDGEPQTAGRITFDTPSTFVVPSGGGGGQSTKVRNAVKWEPDYAPGQRAEALTMVQDDGWLMIANTPTEDRAAPQPTGPEQKLFNGTLTPEQDTAKQVAVGIVASVEQTSYLLGYEVDTIVGNHYTVFSVRAGVVTELVTFEATRTGWTTFNINAVFLLPGVEFSVWSLVREPDPTPVTFDGPWDYTKPGGSSGPGVDPSAGQIAHASNSQSILKISKTDNAAADRSAELEALTIGDIIENQSIRWAIQAVADDGAFMTFQVAPAAQAQNTGVSTFTFETVVATPITTGRDAGYWDSVGLPNIRGAKVVDGDWESATPTADAFGVNLIVQPVDVSPDWDYMSSGAAAGASTPTRINHSEIASFETTTAQNPTGLGAAGAIVTNFGAGGSSDDGEFDVSAAGVITANEPANGDEFEFLISFRIGRSAAAGVSRIMLRFMYAPDGVVGNAFQVGGTFGVEIDDQDTVWREVFDISFAPAVGSVVFVELARDPSGNDSGGLLAFQPSGDVAGWNPIATARVQIQRVDLV